MTRVDRSLRSLFGRRGASLAPLPAAYGSGRSAGGGGFAAPPGPANPRRPARARVLAALFGLAALVASACSPGGGGAAGPAAGGAAAPPASTAGPRVLDAFDAVSAWEAAPADGVSLEVSRGEGVEGGALRLDFDFHGRGGYAVARRALPVALPDNYEITFAIRGDAPPNTLEFKLVDPSGENVWWVNRRDFVFPASWDTVSIRKRHVTFAWGPAGGGELERVGSLELAITAGSGGRGTVWIDDLRIRPLPPRTVYDLQPTASASVEHPGAPAGAAVDGDTATAWRAGPGAASLTIDYLRERELGGLVLRWAPGAHATHYRVLASADGEAWRELRRVENGDGGEDPLMLPETDARWLRLELERGAGGVGYALRAAEAKPLEWGASHNAFFETVAAGAPRGAYPRYLLGELGYWTVAGVPRDAEEALVGEDGPVEPFPEAFSIEPFLHDGGRLITWADADTEARLRDGDLPIPTVAWRAGPLRLEVTAIPRGEPGASALYLRYTVHNDDAAAASPTLFLAIRPFQVNPSSQFLNQTSGYTPITALEWDGRAVAVTGAAGGAGAAGAAGEAGRVPSRTVIALTEPAAFGATTFDAGGIVSWLRRGRVPAAAHARDPFGAASGALAYPLELAPGDSAVVGLAVPWHAATPAPGGGPTGEAGALLEEAVAEEAARWRRLVDRVEVELPGDAARLAETLRATQAYILVNMDGPAIQPGSRAYARSWIRDGALTSAALLRLGHTEPVREFLTWYSGYLYDDGKVPCCVDRHGAGPVPEHDSDGEYIYLAMEYFRHTGDRALLRELWPGIRGAAAHMDALRARRMTAEYRTPEKRVFYGLLPESISHEGYSAKPMHSYWDQLWGLRGYRDAAAAADSLGLEDEAARLARTADEFQAQLAASFERAMEVHGIDFLPGAAELGDFDAASTTIGVTPVEATWLPDDALRATFDRYLQEFRDRRDGRREWDAYTPYELRTVGTFVRLGRAAEAHEILDWFMGHQRPEGWRHWAEVVARDDREPRFIGDMPHTWVGSDFIRSVLDLLAYEREADGAIVLAAGVPTEWLDGGGVRVEGLRTHYGALDLRVTRGGTGGARIELGGEADPPAGFRLRGPLLDAAARAVVDGRRVAPEAGELAAPTGTRVIELHFE